MNSPSNNSSLAESDPSVIRAELDRLLSDRRFSGARQMSAFLRYIVCETLKGNGSRIKAYTVGVDALGKPDDFDAQADPSVRVLALRLRKTLAAAYEDNSDCLARVVLRVGTYVPEFYKPEAFAEAQTQPVLQRPDHASVNDVLSDRSGVDVSANDQRTSEDGLGVNSVSRRSDNPQQTGIDRFRRTPLRRRGPLSEALAKNTAAFTGSDISSLDLRVPFTTMIILLALLQATLNSANAQPASSVNEVSSAKYTSVSAYQYTSLHSQELD
ncbi:hypothetical protein ACUNV4_07390 [Granulosicoccus sp. 3-233]|uniref:hypothetical protein n=1 Tax=Granulosicoccus sp. 3-233 TaxID=3417969 RepID=UPI003D335B96